MIITESKKINQKIYTEILENGMKIIVIPNSNTKKKYIIWATKFGSIDNHFYDPITNKEMQVPDGVAHYLEHKMFEQESGVDSLYTLMALGLDANAYTTNDHTAYLFSGTDNFYKGLDEFMDYVQHPYYTDENVEKERGIIEQEIQRYDDEPFFSMYINAMRCLYKNNPITIDTAGTIETISHITKEILYSCYNTFYHPSNMIMCIAGNFNPQQIVEEIKKRLIPREKEGRIKRFYPEYENTINKKYIEKQMSVNMPMFMIGYRDFLKDENKIKKDLAVKIIFNSIIGKCSNLHQELYNEGLITRECELDYEFSDEYAHVLIGGESKEPKKVYKAIIKALETEEITKENFERSKKRIYGEMLTTYEDVEEIGRLYLANAIKGIDTLDYIKEIEKIDLKYVQNIKEKIFKSKDSILSLITKKK